MNIQVLVAAMNQNDHSLLNKMNIQTDAIIGNQCDRNEIEYIKHNGYETKYLSFKERGVGLNRNNALMRATADICILSDDDIIFDNDYSQRVLSSFEKHQNADVIIFSLLECNRNGVIKRQKKVDFYNYMRFGTPQIAFRRVPIIKQGICFNMSFGGGSRYCSGEDTLFLTQCLKKGLKIIALPVIIGRIEKNRESTWFTGFDSKFLFDRGALFSAISAKLAKALCIQFLLRHRFAYVNEGYSFFEAYRFMKNGIKDFRDR